MIKLYIVRHGKTDWNKEGIIQGITDIPLNEEGINDSKTLKLEIDKLKIDICISSPLKRALETAKIITDSKIIIDELLIERKFGNYEGTKVNDDFFDKYWYYALNSSDNDVESIKTCLERARIFLEKIKKQYDNKTILIVTHGGFIKALYYNIIGYNIETDFNSFYATNTTIYEFEI